MKTLAIFIHMERHKALLLFIRESLKRGRGFLRKEDVRNLYRGGATFWIGDQEGLQAITAPFTEVKNKPDIAIFQFNDIEKMPHTKGFLRGASKLDQLYAVLDLVGKAPIIVGEFPINILNELQKQ